MAAENGVVNVVRYYHHETVHVHGVNDGVRSNVQKGLDATKATDELSTATPNDVVKCEHVECLIGD